MKARSAVLKAREQRGRQANLLLVRLMAEQAERNRLIGQHLRLVALAHECRGIGARIAAARAKVDATRELIEAARELETAASRANV